jgi:hypothetical protein
MGKFIMRFCGNEWMYCDGICHHCSKAAGYCSNEIQIDTTIEITNFLKVSKLKRLFHKIKAKISYYLLKVKVKFRGDYNA